MRAFRLSWEKSRANFDILPASVIEQTLDDHVRSWFDAKLWQRRDAEIERARILL